MVAVVLALVGALGSGCTADAAQTVDGRGGSVSFPAAGGLTITVPAGAVSATTRVEADTDQPAPASTFGPDVRPPDEPRKTCRSLTCINPRDHLGGRP